MKYSTRHVDAAIALIEEVEAERLTATGRMALSMALYCFEESRDCEKADDITKLLNTGRGFLNTALACDGKSETAKVAEALDKIDAKRKKRQKLAVLK